MLDPKLQKHNPNRGSEQRAAQDITIEVQFYIKDRTPIWVQQYVSPVKDDQERIVQHFASFIDITESKRAEDRLQRMTEDLDRRVRARTKRLEQTNGRLKEELERRAALEGVLRAALEDKQDRVREKESMIKEANHRIMNAFQAAQSLLLIQSHRESSDAVKDALKSAVQRLAQFAELHELLNQTEGYQSIDVSKDLEIPKTWRRCAVGC